MSAYRSPPAPTFEPLCSFSKARPEAVEAERRRTVFLMIPASLLILVSLGAMVFTLATGGGVLYVGLLPIAGGVFVLSLLRGKLQTLRQLGVRVSYCRQTRTVRFDSDPSMRVELAVSDLVALSAVEEPLEPIAVRMPQPRARFALIAETKTGPIVIAQPLVCTGAGYIAMGRAYLTPALDALRRTIDAAAKAEPHAAPTP